MAADVSGSKNNARILPGLPELQRSDLRTLAGEQLMLSGKIKSPRGFFDRFQVDRVVRQATPAIKELKMRNGGAVDEVVARREIDRAAYELQVSKANRQSWIRSAGVFLVSVAAFTAVGWGIGYGIHYFWQGALAEGIQRATDPIWFNVGGALSGAGTGLFIDKLTQPFRAWNVKFILKKSPLQPSFSPRVTADFVLANQAEGTVDGRFNGGRTNLIASNLDLSRALTNVRDILGEIKAAKDQGAKAQLLKEAGMFIAGRLIQNETFWFNIDPTQDEISNLINIVFGPHFMGVSDADKKAIFDAALEYVRARRPLPAGDGRKDLETAIKDYFTPYLNTLMRAGSTQQVANSDAERNAEHGVANAG